jgi:hypothetical protein
MFWPIESSAPYALAWDLKSRLKLKRLFCAEAGRAKRAYDKSAMANGAFIQFAKSKAAE